MQLQGGCLGRNMSILFWALSGQKFLEADMQNSAIMPNLSRPRKREPSVTASLNQTGARAPAPGERKGG